MHMGETNDSIRVSVQGPRGLNIAEQETLLRTCANDLIELGFPFEKLTLTSDDLQLEVGPREEV